MLASMNFLTLASMNEAMIHSLSPRVIAESGRLQMSRSWLVEVYQQLGNNDFISRVQQDLFDGNVREVT